MKGVVGTAIVALMVSAGAAVAEPITVSFDFDGGGGATGAQAVSALDWAPGNSVIIANPERAGSFTILYQANLGFADVAPIGSSPGDIQNGAFGSYFTAVAGFDVVVDSVAGGTTTFLFDAASDTNFFKIYRDTAPGNDFAGTGFTDGTLVLSGHAVPDGFGSVFTAVDPDGDGPDAGTAPDRILDATSDGNNWPGVYSIFGLGATGVTVAVDYFDPLYFLNLVAGQTFAFTGTSQIAPYSEVNPSRSFSSDGVANGDTCGVPCVGTVNGTAFSDTDPKTDRIVAQSDASSSFDVTPVPEPASVVLVGMGFLGVAAAVRRRRATK